MTYQQFISENLTSDRVSFSQFNSTQKSELLEQLKNQYKQAKLVSMTKTANLAWLIEQLKANIKQSTVTITKNQPNYKTAKVDYHTNNKILKPQTIQTKYRKVVSQINDDIETAINKDELYQQAQKMTKAVSSELTQAWNDANKNYIDTTHKSQLKKFEQYKQLLEDGLITKEQYVTRVNALTKFAKDYNAKSKKELVSAIESNDNYIKAVKMSKQRRSDINKLYQPIRDEEHSRYVTALRQSCQFHKVKLVE